MPLEKIRVLPDNILREKCLDVDKITPETEHIISQLVDQVKLPGRSGLSANQIGYKIRAFSYNFNNEIGYIINPKIVEIDKENKYISQEGCLSVPNVWANTERAKYTKVEGVDLKGKKVTLAGYDEFSKLLQHELDHLSGVLFIDRLSKKDRLKALTQLSIK